MCEERKVSGLEGKMNHSGTVMLTDPTSEAISIRKVGDNKCIFMCILAHKIAYDENILRRAMRLFNEPEIVVVPEFLDGEMTMMRVRKNLRKMITQQCASYFFQANFLGSGREV